MAYRSRKRSRGRSSFNRRRKMSRGRSKKLFSRAARPHRKNSISGRPMRGGIRL